MSKTFSEIINSDTPTLVDFFAEWCGPCKMMKPILSDFKNEMKDAANVIKIDIDQNPAAASKYQIQSVPTLLIFKNGDFQATEGPCVFLPKFFMLCACACVLAEKGSLSKLCGYIPRFAFCKERTDVC